MRVEKASPFYESLIVWDAHTCLPLDPKQDLSALERHRAAGATFVHLNVGMDYNPLDQIVRVIAGFRAWLSDHSGKFCWARSTDDIRCAKKTGRLAVAFDLEGSLMLQNDVNMLAVFYDLGVRQMHLAYNRDNLIAGGCYDQNRGLGELGPKTITRMNELGIVLDCSHMSERSSLEAMEISSRPVIFSHSNVKALVDHPRNLSDSQIDACAKTDGVIGITGIGAFLGNGDISTHKFLEHIDYLIDRIGSRHIGLGLDYVFDPNHRDLPSSERHDHWYPDHEFADLSTLSCKPPEHLPEIAAALLERGYMAEDVRGVMGGNFLRVAELTWS